MVAAFYRPFDALGQRAPGVGFISLCGAGRDLRNRDRRQFVTVLAASSLAISLGVLALLPDARTYRGLSGLDTALFAAMAISMLIHSVREQRRGWSSVIAVLLISLIGKIALEMLTDRALFVDASAAGFEPLPLSHLVGTSVGITVGLFRECEARACPNPRAQLAMNRFQKRDGNFHSPMAKMLTAQRGPRLGSSAALFSSAERVVWR